MTKGQAEAMNKRFVEMNVTIRQMADRELITQQQKDSLLGALQYCEYQFQVSQLGLKGAMDQYNELKFKRNQVQPMSQSDFFITFGWLFGILTLMNLVIIYGG
jgi:hypothetical protein